MLFIKVIFVVLFCVSMFSCYLTDNRVPGYQTCTWDSDIETGTRVFVLVFWLVDRKGIWPVKSWVWRINWSFCTSYSSGCNPPKTPESRQLLANAVAPENMVVKTKRERERERERDALSLDCSGLIVSSSAGD